MKKTFAVIITASAMLLTHGTQQAFAAETTKETVDKCLQELQSPNVELRRRAAMLIGKYDTVETRRALIKCLQDTDSQVRQSALVAFTENAYIPPEAKQWIYKLLADENVHLRRLSSSLLPQLYLGMGQAIFTRRANNEPLSPEAARLITNALQDSDASVRKNVLMAAKYFYGILDADKVTAFFQDDAEEMRVMALQTYSRMECPNTERIIKLSTLLKDPSPKVRLQLVPALTSCGQPACDALKTLTQDENQDVRIEAIRRYAMMRGEGALPLLAAAIEDTSIPQAKRAELCRLLAIYPNDASELIVRLSKSKDELLQAEAIRLLTMQSNAKLAAENNIDSKFFMELLASPSADVRNYSINWLKKNASKQTPEELRRIFSSQYPDVRIFVMFLICKQPKNEKLEELLLDGCIDDVSAVRMSALHAVREYRISNYIEVLIASLDDDDPAVQQEAAVNLTMLSMTPQVRSALEKYRSRCKSPLLLRRINQLIPEKIYRTPPRP